MRQYVSPTIAPALRAGEGVRDEADKRHLMELATTYRRTADQMAPPTSEQDKARP